MSDVDYMLRPCSHCPFRRDVRPFLHPLRAEEIAYSSLNKYSDFPCHKTIDHNDDDEVIYSTQTKTCAGFKAMQINEGGAIEPVNYEWPDGVYNDAWEMIEAYEDAWENSNA